MPRQAAWYRKRQITFSDALATVRRQLWVSETFETSRDHRNPLEIPRSFFERITAAACYPA
ncbi:hypothetical protein VSX63_17715, partial [Aurantimonas sp. C2-4-R8]|nr:hypothetical protein [Aurantimonas sp. C2-4-R8]